MKVYSNEKLFADEVKIADSFLSRLRGLMFVKKLTAGGGILLKNCSAVHCLFMRFPIDIVYLDKNMKVINFETVKPWRIGRIYRGTKNVLELAEGASKGLGRTMFLSFISNL